MEKNSAKANKNESDERWQHRTAHNNMSGEWCAARMQNDCVSAWDAETCLVPRDRGYEPGLSITIFQWVRNKIAYSRVSRGETRATCSSATHAEYHSQTQPCVRYFHQIKFWSETKNKKTVANPHHATVQSLNKTKKSSIIIMTWHTSA